MTARDLDIGFGPVFDRLIKSEPERQPKFALGTQFKTRGKHPRLCKVIDILRTYNSAGELVQLRYVATHDLLGAPIVDKEVCETTIAMGLYTD